MKPPWNPRVCACAGTLPAVASIASPWISCRRVSDPLSKRCSSRLMMVSICSAPRHERQELPGVVLRDAADVRGRDTGLLHLRYEQHDGARVSRPAVARVKRPGVDADLAHVRVHATDVVG